MRRAGLTLLALLAACAPDDSVDPALEREAAEGIARVLPYAEKYGERIELADAPGLRMARRFQGHVIFCGVRPDGTRQIVIDNILRETDSGLQGPTFAYIWRRADC